MAINESDLSQNNNIQDDSSKLKVELNAFYSIVKDSGSEINSDNYNSVKAVPHVYKRFNDFKTSYYAKYSQSDIDREMKVVLNFSTSEWNSFEVDMESIDTKGGTLEAQIRTYCASLGTYSTSGSIEYGNETGVTQKAATITLLDDVLTHVVE